MLMGVDMTSFLPDRHGKLRTVSTSTPAEPSLDAAADDDDDIVLLPWWRNPLNLIMGALALFALGGAIGFVWGNNSAIPDPNAVDAGYLQDMRYHHEQAVQISLIFLEVPGTNPALRTTAREIVVGQDIEIGQMVQLLRGFGKAESIETELAMAGWGAPAPLSRVPGLAVDADLERLGKASGPQADELFVTLMVAHHQGGVHMARYAQANAATPEVRRMAKQTIGSQLDEIDEMNKLLAAEKAG